jgi:hypothetical protein
VHHLDDPRELQEERLEVAVKLLGVLDGRVGVQSDVIARREPAEGGACAVLLN